MSGRQRFYSRVLVCLVVLILAALACTAPGASEPTDHEGTVAAIYATITQQAGLPRLTDTPASLPATPTQGLPATGTPPDSRTPPTVIHTCPGPITIDTKVGDWPDSVTGLNVDQVVYDPHKEWSGPADLNAAVKICWTNDALYLLVNVTDDVHYQTQSGENSYLGDEVEVLYDSDLRGDFFNTKWDADDSQLSLNPGEFGVLIPAAYRYRPTPGAAPGVTLDAKKVAHGSGADYRVEAQIAWSELGGAPANAANYGLCIAVSDADHPDQPPAEDSLLSSCPGMISSNPTTWVSVTFVNP